MTYGGASEAKPWREIGAPLEPPAGYEPGTSDIDPAYFEDADAGFVVVPFADLSEQQPDPPGYIWHDRVPCGHVTLFSGHGGAGKSTIALTMAVCTAAGLPLYGLPITQAPVVMFSAEDGAHLVRHRLHNVCRVLGVPVESLRDKLFILDATDHDPILFTEINAAGRREGITTPVYDQLRDFVVAHKAGLLIVDNASDVYDCSEIDRAKVRAFMRSLAAIGREADAGVVLLAHVDKGTSRGDRTGSESYSGSTGWHNSSRSRLFLSRDRDGRLTLTQEKHNLGAIAAPIELCWPAGGIPEVDRPLSPVVQGISDRNDEKALLKLIVEFSARGEHISTAEQGRSCLTSKFAKEPGYPAKLKAGDVFHVLRQSERAGRLTRTSIRTENRKSRELWQVTAEGFAFAGIPAPNAPNAPNPEIGAMDAISANGRAKRAKRCAGGVGE